MKPRYCPICARELVPVNLEQRERLACPGESCGYVFWDNPVPVVAALVEHEGKILLAHNSAWSEDWYALIAGYLEKNETPEEGVLREIREEIGLQAEIEELIGLYQFPLKNQLLIVYFVRAEGKVRLSEEIDRVKYLAPEDLVPWEMGTGPAVRDWKKRHGF